MDHAETPLVKSGKSRSHEKSAAELHWCIIQSIILAFGVVICALLIYFYGPNLSPNIPFLSLTSNVELAKALQNSLLYIPLDDGTKIDEQTMEKIKTFYNRDDVLVHKGVDRVYATLLNAQESPNAQESKVWFQSLPLQHFETLINKNQLPLLNKESYGALTDSYKYVTSFKDAGIQPKEASHAESVFVITSFTLPQPFFKLVSDEHAILKAEGKPPMPKTEFGANVYELTGQKFQFKAKLDNKPESDFTAPLGYFFQDLLNKGLVDIGVAGMYMPLDKAGSFSSMWGKKLDKSRRKT